jgi:GSCFA family
VPNGSCPYSAIPAYARWQDAVGSVAPRDVDPHAVPAPFINRSTRVASAGSCFAQHVSRHLRSAGFNYFVAEAGAPWLSDGDRLGENYGVFSARYGNIYTTLQLLQLFRHAFGPSPTTDEFWRGTQGGFVDPQRPFVQPGGFATETECRNDRVLHLAAVRRLFEKLDVFVFTLGLTEGWRRRTDGAMLPACPGCGAGGEYDPSRYEFVNFTLAEVVGHLREFLDDLARVNANAKVILTVSPVPLAATYEDRHVLAATVYSKSVLRVACEEIIRSHVQARYFASYEIVTAFGGANNFLDDRRSISEAAVTQVMNSFFRQFCFDLPQPQARISIRSATDVHPGKDEQIGKIVCDEEALLAELANTRVK